jgi:hypothetical protein
MHAVTPPPARALQDPAIGQLSGVVYAGADPLTGRERYLRETAPTYAGAEQALIHLQSQVDEDRHPKSAITVRQAISSGSTSPNWRTPLVSGTTI